VELSVDIPVQNNQENNDPAEKLECGLTPDEQEPEELLLDQGTDSNMEEQESEGPSNQDNTWTISR